jgi:phospholipase/carboxylesterase
MKLSGPFKIPYNGKRPSKMVIFLHGVGADGHDLINLADEFEEVLDTAVFLSPNAPFPYDNFPMGYQWFSLKDYSEDKLYEGIEKSLPILKDYIDENLAAYKLEYKDLVLIGFSQGSMMAMHMAPRLGDSCLGVICYSGALVKPSKLKDAIKSTPSIFLCHGEEDMVVPVSMHKLARQELKKMGFEVQDHIIAHLGHGISLEGIDLAKEFLKNRRNENE